MGLYLSKLGQSLETIPALTGPAHGYNEPDAGELDPGPSDQVTVFALAKKSSRRTSPDSALYLRPLETGANQNAVRGAVPRVDVNLFLFDELSIVPDLDQQLRRRGLKDHDSICRQELGVEGTGVFAEQQPGQLSPSVARWSWEPPWREARRGGGEDP